MTRKSLIEKTWTALGLTAAAGLVAVTFPSGALANPTLIDPGVLPTIDTEHSDQGDNPDPLPEALELTGIVRDFRERTADGGHPDFERQPGGGFGHYQGMVADELGSDGKPVFASQGSKVSTQWRNSSGQNVIAPKEYIDGKAGDAPGGFASSSGALESAGTLQSWFRDVPGMNVSAPLTITLQRQGESNVYTFDDRYDEQYADLGGFFPINGQLFGNSAGNDRNYHFTYELNTEFVYEEGAGHTFSFIGDDDVWVYVDGRLVIDLGGVHGKTSQTIELDRLDWLQDGETYSLHFFFAERHRTQSNFRIETTINLRNAELPAVSGMFD